MVGVPSSKGCSTCRTRSIKCDEAQPSCYQCRRGGRKCPGYRRDLKFVDESAKLQDKVDGKRDESSTPKSSATSVRGPTRELDNQISRRSSAKPDVRSPAVPKLGIRMSSRYLEQEGIVASFIQDIFPLGRSTVQLSFIGSWLWHVPEVLQKNHAMDFAAEALALVYFAKKANSMDTLVRSHWAYANALRDLSRALQDHSSRFASETLCATLLLVHYENFVEIPGTSWIAHAGGASRLIQLRGPDRHRSGFDCAMFMASRGYLVCLNALPRQRRPSARL
ncbi:hypothetical protein K432DRAFT_308489 [Lepidopterella palustris CBS 459.81]|uniref:Zn(2)-C6 fungal-type domain-containing protein n=1 Tax=Lepidopterella palustris CBS 459.81 TaxID=1314670 RepID=A0A8E2JB24_9PEZI|nr:hypothetical protein K432DRAFT_308489 [Lepidopterella palustris CBS 459.81]